MKKTFEAPEILLVRIGEQDILTTSGENDGHDSGQIGW